jgi:hypothetical protein
MSRKLYGKILTGLVPFVSLRFRTKGANVRTFSIHPRLAQRRYAPLLLGCLDLRLELQIADAVSLGLLSSTEPYIRDQSTNGIIRSSFVLACEAQSTFLT